MKIGILTYHAVYNFGANLQALSTYNYLKKIGHDPIMIDFFPEELEKAFDRTVPKEQACLHKEFIKEHFVLTKRCRDSKEIANEINNNRIAAVIIGSDAVVQHYPYIARLRIIPSRKSILQFRLDPVRYETNFPNPFWGEFIDLLKHRIPIAMMSVSSQNTDYKAITGRVKRSINELRKKISYISVRDERTKLLFKHISNGKCRPKVTPDPVFGFNDNILNSTTKDKIIRKFNLPDKYLLLSFNSSKTVSRSWLSSFENIAKHNGYHCVALAMPGGIKFDNSFSHTLDIPLDPMDWYNIIRFSSAYIGEKMHPVIVSIHNCVPFYSFDHYGILRFKLFLNNKTSKIFQILERAILTDHRISIAKRFNFNAPSPEYVFEKINTFNKEKCSTFSKQMREEYNEMMVCLLKTITNNK